MLIACNRQGEVLAAEVEPQDGPFHCPECAEPVILKQGRVKIAHFAHYPGVDCAYASASGGESEEHRLAKQEIFQALLQVPGVRDVRLERSLRGVRPDVSCRINGEMVAIDPAAEQAFHWRHRIAHTGLCREADRSPLDAADARWGTRGALRT